MSRWSKAISAASANVIFMSSAWEVICPGTHLLEFAFGEKLGSKRIGNAVIPITTWRNSASCGLQCSYNQAIWWHQLEQLITASISPFES